MGAYKENKAIEYLKEEIKSLEKAKIEFFNEIEDKGWLQKNINELDNDIFYKNTLLNLIEKLKKENEELKNKVIKRDNDIIYLEETAEKEFITKQEVKDNYIPKDKIREKIEDYKNEIECEKSYLEQGIICEEEYKDRVKVYNSYIFILNKLLEEE